MTSLPHLGEILALTTALLWAVAVILFKKSGETVHPVALNLFKSVLACALILPTIWLIEGTSVPDFSRGDLLLMLLSGALGIGIADTLFFMMLNRLGAALTSIVDCLYGPMVIAASMIWLGERLSWLQFVGVALIVSGVWEGVKPTRKETSVGLTAKPIGNTEAPLNPPISADRNEGRSALWGVAWGIAAMACMAISIVIMKPMFDKYSLLWVMEVRQVGGIAALLFILAVSKQRREILKTMLIKTGRGFMLSSSFVGQYLALIVWAAGIKYTQASQASALNQTSNLLVFVLAVVFLKERLTIQRVIGIVLGVAGVYLVTFG